MTRPRLFLIDTFGFIFRAYHARARMGLPPMRTSTGLNTEAVLIVNNMLKKLVKTWKPAYIAAIFESLGKTHRDAEYAQYKANRTETPPDLIEQIPYVEKMIQALKIPVIQSEGFEADDVIGTFCQKGVDAGCDVVIVSSDKDMLQLVNEHVFMLDPRKDDLWYDAAKVKEFMGVEPHQVADLLALMGDAVDNIPGAPGIGEKGARDLIGQYGSVEAAMERAGEVTRKTYRESLLNNREQIELSKRLATIRLDAPEPFELEALRATEPDADLLRVIYKELEFFSSLKELAPGEDKREKDLAAFTDIAQLTAWLAQRTGPLSVTLSTSGDDIGFAFRSGEGRSCPVAWLPAVVTDAAVPKAAADVKALHLYLLKHGLAAQGFAHDVGLYSFLLDADPAGTSLEAMVQRRLDVKPGPRADERALYVQELRERLEPEITNRPGLRKLYDEIELPLTAVLARMEHTGIVVDAAELARMSGLMEIEVNRLTADIHRLAGHDFNIASPQQLGRVLFEEMHIQPPGKTAKGKAPSTAADVLDLLAPDHEIVRKVLEYRQLTKLKGTYVDALPQLIDPRTGRVHTSFNQAGAATGRLSSSNPNLQNIPVKTEMGREIRTAFKPRAGWKLLVADYSQIELRLLAHMSQDEVLMDAFRNGEDIHTRTASEVLGVPPMLITREARNSAKAVNFGIVYGISGFGLAANLGISRKEAEAYIKNYFERYKGVRRFIDDTIAHVRQSGITRTLFGRERPIPDMNSRNPAARGFAERTAVNSPIQGTAADLIKIAMIRIDKALLGLQSKLLLQVHDELVLESPPEEVDSVRTMVNREMEGVCELLVPLVVDTGVGDNWRDAK